MRHTSIGANVRESVYAQSRADFNSKMYIALKEASESAYWLELLADTDYLTPMQAQSMLDDCNELIKILSSITKTTKERKENPECQINS
ncbi:MAG: four helix bundle protein [Selenomonadaceae bacterium]|nr:four helix bundle protein [Selenomonadaceae bacterium]